MKRFKSFMHRKAAIKMKYNYCCFSDRDYKKACWLIENKCNLNCEFCFHKEFHNNQKKNETDYMTIVSNLRQNSIKHVILSGGEPLLSQDLFHIISILENNNFEVSICTNAILATRDFCQKLKSTTSVKKITVNLSSICDNNGAIIYDDKSKSVVSGICNLLEFDFEVTVNSILYKSTTKGILEKNIRHCIEWGAKLISFTVPVCKCSKNNCSDYYIEENRIQELKKYLQDIENQADTPINIIFNYPLCNSDDCPANKSIYGIGYDGVLSTCVVKQYR